MFYYESFGNQLENQYRILFTEFVIYWEKLWKSQILRGIHIVVQMYPSLDGEHYIYLFYLKHNFLLQIFFFFSFCCIFH